MVVSKIVSALQFTGETVKGAALVLANPNAKIPESKIVSHMPARPFTGPEWLRMWSWRHNWKLLPVFRYYVFSGMIVYGIFKFVLPIKPRHGIQYTQGYENSHHHEVEHWYGYRQQVQDALYFKKYNPLKKAGEAEVGGH
uniref:ATP synthase subunit f, mitochondrial n=1 Tax=Rhabditophanes sp. KR3021 TaxID=114890 RepID=A0AC35TJH2_9BILA